LQFAGFASKFGKEAERFLSGKYDLPMIRASEIKIIQFLVIATLGGVSLIITPKFSMDPINIPKLFILTPLALAAFLFIFNAPKMIFDRYFRWPFAFALLFFLQITLVLTTSNVFFAQLFYGTSGRNTGYLAYVSLLAIFLATVVATNYVMNKKIAITLFFCGALTVGYGILQTTGNDFISWNNPYNNIIGFLGNPNFASSFLGMSSMVGVALLFGTSLKVYQKALIVVYEAIAFFLIFKSDSIQGVIVFALSSSLILFLYLRYNEKIANIYSYLLAGLTTVAGIVAVFGILNKGPLAAYLYATSVRQRGFYWDAGIKMMNANPVFGVGLDSYGDNYLKFRSSDAEFYSRVTQSNAAHNVFLDIGSNGGYPLFIVYIALVIFTFWKAVTTFRKLNAFDPYFVSIFAAWVAYQAQSIISINQLGLAVWGWALSGAIIGYSIFVARKGDADDTSEKNPRKNRNSTSHNPRIILPTIGLIVGASFTTPLLLTDNNYFKALSSGDANKVITAVTAFPEDLIRTTAAAEILAKNNLIDQSRDLLNRVVEKSPNSYNAWVLLSSINPEGSKEREIAFNQMKLLDPQNKSYK
jgi:O-antigen ligase